MIRDRIPLDKLVIFMEVMKDINRIVEEENSKIKAREPEELPLN
jgi:hypothetical protein